MRRLKRIKLKRKIRKLEKQSKKLRTYKPPKQLFTIKRYIGTVEHGYWRGNYYRNGAMFTPHLHKSCRFRTEQSADWALKNSDLIYDNGVIRYKIIRVK